ncbi:hypothetical protein DM02DRAFT_665308 [Periconia macrospinosa]|uniref:Uncharacterized protein n=1 Tax=Periconia macrospinosa TaxID=97972 RepID=A0A2V1CX05_9PLEO|nr:hypothetical protein DM02DRAFT_665308 [Periconia macrospinosa]
MSEDEWHDALSRQYDEWYKARVEQNEKCLECFSILRRSVGWEKDLIKLGSKEWFSPGEYVRRSAMYTLAVRVGHCKNPAAFFGSSPQLQMKDGRPDVNLESTLALNAHISGTPCPAPRKRVEESGLVEEALLTRANSTPVSSLASARDNSFGRHHFLRVFG